MQPQLFERINPKQGVPLSSPPPYLGGKPGYLCAKSACELYGTLTSSYSPCRIDIRPIRSCLNDEPATRQAYWWCRLGQWHEHGHAQASQEAKGVPSQSTHRMPDLQVSRLRELRGLACVAKLRQDPTFAMWRREACV